jgi:hypothetical protein
MVLKINIDGVGADNIYGPSLMDTNDASIQGPHRNPTCSLVQNLPAPYLWPCPLVFGKRVVQSLPLIKLFRLAPHCIFLHLFEISCSFCTRLYDGPYYEAGVKLWSTLMFGHKWKNAKFDENNCRHFKANFDNDKVFGFELFFVHLLQSSMIFNMKREIFDKNCEKSCHFYESHYFLLSDELFSQIWLFWFLTHLIPCSD